MNPRSIEASTALLCLILGVAFGLRAWGVSFGLPFVYHPDEGFEVIRALQLGAGEIDQSAFRMLKGGYFYLIFVEFGVLFVVSKAFGIVDTTADFAMWFVRDPTAFYLIGRLTTAAIGTVAVLLAYRIGARVHSKRVGLIAAALLACNTLQVIHSHYITVDIPLTCLCLAALLFMVCIEQSGSRADYFWAFLFVALATVTKLPGLMLMIPLIAVHALRASRSEEPFLRAFFNRNVLVGGALFLIVFCVSNPAVLLHFDNFARSILDLVSTRQNARQGSTDSGSMGRVGNVMFYVQATHKTVGIPLIAAAVLGAIAAALGRMRMVLVLLLFGLCYFLLIALAANPHFLYVRYTLPIAAVVMLLAAIGLDWLLRKFGPSGPISNYIAVLVTLVGAAHPFIESAKAGMEFNAKDTRTVAKEWFDRNVPDGAKVLIEGHTGTALTTTVPLRNSKENLSAAIWEFERRGERGKARYFELEMRTAREKRFDLQFYKWYAIDDWAAYADSGVEYVVVRPASLLISPKYEAHGRKFIHDLRADPEFAMAASFSADSGRFRGPVLEIYGRR